MYHIGGLLSGGVIWTDIVFETLRQGRHKSQIMVEFGRFSLKLKIEKKDTASHCKLLIYTSFLSFLQNFFPKFLFKICSFCTFNYLYIC